MEREAESSNQGIQKSEGFEAKPEHLKSGSEEEKTDVMSSGSGRAEELPEGNAPGKKDITNEPLSSSQEGEVIPKQQYGQSDSTSSADELAEPQLQENQENTISGSEQEQPTYGSDQEQSIPSSDESVPPESPYSTDVSSSEQTSNTYEYPQETGYDSSSYNPDTYSSEYYYGSNSGGSDDGNPPPAETTDDNSEEEEGGPVKPFLEHLEDLRWTLVKSVTAIILGMLICLVAGRYLVAVMMWPLKCAERVFNAQKNDVAIFLGTNIIARGDPATLGFTNLFGTNKPYSLQIVPVQVGTNSILALQPVPDKEVPPPTMVVIKNYSPVEGIMVALKLALYGGLVVAFPFVMYFIGQFVLPALRVNEKRILFKTVAFSGGLFLLGVVFCYFIVAVFALGATVQFSNWLGFEANEWRADAYLSFVIKFMLGMGLAFQLPVIILLLVKIGLIDYTKLSKFRSYAFVANLTIAAIATPSGDPFTMLLMALPLQALYEISYFVAKYWDWKERKKAEKAKAS